MRCASALDDISTSTCSSAILPAGVARGAGNRIDAIRTVFFAYAAYLVWNFMAIVEGETMTTIMLPKNWVYGCGLRRIHPDVHPVSSGIYRELAPWLLDPGETGGV